MPPPPWFTPGGLTHVSSEPDSDVFATPPDPLHPGVGELVRFWLGDEGFGPFLERVRTES